MSSVRACTHDHRIGSQAPSLSRHTNRGLVMICNNITYYVSRYVNHFHAYPFSTSKFIMYNIPDIQDEYHVTLCCVYFKELRRKYIKPYYYKRPSMNKFVELMKTRNKREIHRIMLFAKFAFKKYLDTLLE